jgi:hypothetical protein
VRRGPEAASTMNPANPPYRLITRFFARFSPATALTIRGKRKLRLGNGGPSHRAVQAKAQTAGFAPTEPCPAEVIQYCRESHSIPFFGVGTVPSSPAAFQRKRV